MSEQKLPTDIPFPSGEKPEPKEKEAGLLEIVGWSSLVGAAIGGVVALLIGWLMWGSPLQESEALVDMLAEAELQASTERDQLRAATERIADGAFYAGVLFGCEFDKAGGDMFKVTGEDVGCLAVSRSAFNARLDLAAKSKGEQ